MAVMDQAMIRLIDRKTQRPPALSNGKTITFLGSPQQVDGVWRQFCEVGGDGEICEDCTRPVAERVGSYWLADDELWAAVVGEELILCPRCFGLRAERAGVGICWQARPEGTFDSPIG